MKIRLKLIIGYVIVSFFSVIVGFWGMLAIGKMSNSFNRINEETIPVIKFLENLRFAALRIVSSTSEFILISAEKKAEGMSEEERMECQEREQELIQQGIEIYKASLKQFEIIEQSFPEERPFLEDLESTGKGLLRTSKELIQLKKKGTSGYKILKAKERFEAHESAFLSSIDTAINHEEIELSARKEKVATTLVALGASV